MSAGGEDGAKQEHTEPVSDVAEHDAVKEGEGHAGHEARVQFLVTGHSVGVHYLLERVREGVQLEERGPRH